MVVKPLVRGRGHRAPANGSRASHQTSRKQAILQTATEAFAERGFSGASVQDIADAAGAHKTTVLYHFGTKEALYAAVLDEALERIASVMSEFLAGGYESDDLQARVAYLVDQIQAHYAEQPAHARILERELLEAQAPATYLDHFVERIYAPAVAGIELAASRGIIRRIDPALFIHDMHILLVGYFCHRPLLQRLKPGDPLAIEALIARRNHLVDLIFSMLRFNAATT